MKCIAPMIPVWAERIEVEVLRGNRMRVRGIGRSSYLILPRRSSVPIQGFSPHTKKPLHLQFANLQPGELLDYVRKYGPINGKLQHKVRSRDGREITGKEVVYVIQDLDALAREQQLFCCAVKMLSLLQAKSMEPCKMARLISRVGRLYPKISPREKRAVLHIKTTAWVLPFADVPDLTIPRKFDGPLGAERSRAEATRRRLILGGATRTMLAQARIKDRAEAFAQTTVSAGHGVLCKLFNRFPLEMFPSTDGAIELPKYDPAGILPILYFLLRRDYRERHYLIKICPVCAETFKSERGDSLCCDRTCYKRYNDRARYLRKKTKQA